MAQQEAIKKLNCAADHKLLLTAGFSPLSIRERKWQASKHYRQLPRCRSLSFYSMIELHLSRVDFLPGQREQPSINHAEAVPR